MRRPAELHDRGLWARPGRRCWRNKVILACLHACGVMNISYLSARVRFGRLRENIDIYEFESQTMDKSYLFSAVVDFEGPLIDSQVASVPFIIVEVLNNS